MLRIVMCFLGAYLIAGSAFSQVVAERFLPQPIAPMTTSVVNMHELATNVPPTRTNELFVDIPNKFFHEEPGARPPKPDVATGDVLVPGVSGLQFRTMVPSPSPTTTFEGLGDSVAVGTSTSYIPPDTHGAIGLTKIMVTLNNNIRIITKSTGAPVSTVSLTSFFSSTGATGVFDPKVVYDPYNDRWIFTAMSDAATASSSLLLAVSATGDPSGSWYLSRIILGTATLWADFPCIGFNKNWIAISVNMFTISGGTFSSGTVVTYDYAAARAGTFTTTAFTGITSSSGGFCIHPVVTYSSTQDTLFLASHLSSGSATYKISTLTGAVASPALTIGATKTNSLGGWSAPGGDVLPQSPEPSPGTGTAKINVGDAFIRSRALYRNGNIYYSQTVGLPSGGSYTRTAVQWGKVATDGTWLEGGRVDDPTGAVWYAYSSIEVNAPGDILLGFSRFGGALYAGAGYTFKSRDDGAGTMRDPYIYKDGLDYYHKTFGGSRNRWGDFSQTQVDPSDDYTFWTIQEYAKTRVGSGDGSGRWGTWWAKVTPTLPLPVQLASFTGSAQGNTVQLRWRTISEVNNYGFEVERSYGSTNEYQPVPNSFIPGHGTTTEPQSYAFDDIGVGPGIWHYRLKQIDMDGTMRYFDGVRVDVLLTGTPDNGHPASFALDQNYPNPFNPLTTIAFEIPAGGTVSLKVLDLLGREVSTLVDEIRPAGSYRVQFDAGELASGVYLYRLEAGGRSATKKLILVR